MENGKTLFSEAFKSSSPLYKISVNQNFAGEEIQLGAVVDAMEMLYKNVSFGNFFFNVIDWRTYSYPYNSKNSLEVMGYTNEEMTNIEWLNTVIHPDHVPIFNDYAVKILGFVTALPRDVMARTTMNHCFKCMHGRRKEYFWLYQRVQPTFIDKNGILVCSITVITDVSHLHGANDLPTWSVTERLDDGSFKYLMGSEGENEVLNKQKSLTSRELDILNLCAQGFNNKEICKRLNLGYETVVTHRKNIIKKTHSKNITEAVAYALNAGYL